MAKNLIESILNSELDENEFFEWLFLLNPQSDKSQEYSVKFKCSHTDFVTYFLNYIHEEIASEKNEIIEEKPPKRASLVRNQTEINKSHSFPLDLSSSLEENTTSTPKLTKINSETSFQNYTSPISPLYRGQNSFSTPNNKRVTPQKSPLVLGDFLITRRVSSRKRNGRESEEFKRRIKPTNLDQQKSSNSFHKTRNSFNFTEAASEQLPERNVLAEERLKILSRTSPSPSKIKLVEQRQEIQPDLLLVLYKKQLDIIIRIYLGLLRRDFVLNLTSEVYFLVSLLVKKQFNDLDYGIGFLNDRITTQQLFSSIHCITYFTANCLKGLERILVTYDKASIRLLVENVRLKNFAPSLLRNLEKSLTKSDQNLVNFDDFVQSNVCFNTETDNRQNFPNDASFHAFRKQRDLFYEILRIWEQNHLHPGFNYSQSLGGKIRMLFALSNEPVSFVHFSRLFKGQLLGVSKRNFEAISSFDVDAEKLSRLTNRCISKGSEARNLQEFSENEEFYSEFLIVAANFCFYNHLEDCLIQEIVELNARNYVAFDEKENHVDLETKKSFFASIKSLRLLAKFLGFIQAMPYKSDLSYSDYVLSSQIDIRKQTRHSFDSLSILQEAISKNCVIVCVPWITKYLSMLDNVTLRLPYYSEILRILFNLRKSFKSNFDVNTYLVKFCLGSLFELEQFPTSDYFNTFSSNSVETAGKLRTGLDNSEIVDQNILYYCCPHLENVKRVLATTFVNNNVTIKHITPVTALQSSSEIARRKLEQQLEEAFFNGQPISLRKTVEFVSERIASTCVKHICSNLVPNYKKQALERWKKQMNFDVSSEEDLKCQKIAMKTKASEFAVIVLKEFQHCCESEIGRICSERVTSGVEALVSIDILPQTKQVCVEIARRTCLERIKQWLKSHVTVGVFLKDFNDEIGRFSVCDGKKARKPVFLLPPSGSQSNHNDNTTSAAHLLEKIRDFTMVVLEKGSVDRNSFDEILQDCLRSFEERADVNESITATICSQFVDLSIIIHSCDFEINPQELEYLFRIWKFYYSDTNELFKSILSPRNIMIFAQGNSVGKSWQRFAQFCAKLIENEFVSVDCFEGQCTAIFTIEWDKETLGRLTQFFKVFLQFHDSGASSNSNVRFTFLLDFLSDYCDDLCC